MPFTKDSSFAVIKRDWNIFKTQLLSPTNRNGRFVLYFYFLLFTSIIVTPILLPVFDNNLANLSQFLIQFLLIPFLLMVTPLIPFLVANQMLYIIWLAEKSNVSQFKSLSNKDISSFIRSRLYLPLIIATLIIGLFLAMEILLTSYCCSTVFFPFEGIDIVLYAIIVVISTIFFLLMATNVVIRNGNYLLHSISSYPKKRPSDISKDIFKSIESLRKNHIDGRGMVLNLFSYYLVFLFTLPLILNSVYSDWIKFDAMLVGFWTIVWSGVIILISWLLWTRTPQQLKNIPETKYVLSDNIKDILMDYTTEN